MASARLDEVTAITHVVGARLNRPVVSEVAEADGGLNLDLAVVHEMQDVMDVNDAPPQPHGFGSARRQSQGYLVPATDLARVTVVIPTLNEELNIAWVLKRIPAWVDEVVLVDGFSTDRTVEVARAIRPEIVVVTQRGRGKGAALRTGFEAATGGYIVAIDADGSMEPAEIEYYVAALDLGYELVKGSRHLGTSGSLDLTSVRRMGNSALVGAVNLMWGSQLTDLCYGFFGFRRSCLERLGLHARGFEIETEVAVHAIASGLRIAEVPSVELLRHHGQSNLSAWRDGWSIFRLLARERLPLPRRPLVDQLDRRGLEMA